MRSQSRSVNSTHQRPHCSSFFATKTQVEVYCPVSKTPHYAYLTDVTLLGSTSRNIRSQRSAQLPPATMQLEVSSAKERPELGRTLWFCPHPYCKHSMAGGNGTPGPSQSSEVRDWQPRRGRDDSGRPGCFRSVHAGVVQGGAHSTRALLRKGGPSDCIRLAWFVRR